MTQERAIGCPPRNDREVMALLLEGATLVMTDDIYVVEFALSEHGYLTRRVSTRGEWSPWAWTLFLPCHRDITDIRPS